MNTLYVANNLMNKKLVPIIGILLVLGVGGFVYFQQKSGPKMSPEIKKAQQEMMSNCKFDADFCKYAANGIVAMSGGYTMTSESTYNGKKSKMIMKADGKENSESTTYTDGKEEGSFISLNKTTYMKGPGETVWTEFPPTKDETGKQTTNLFDFEGLKKELGNTAKDMADNLVVKKVGSEKCGVYTCTVFEMTEKTSNSTTKIWVDTTKYLARKMEVQSKEGLSTMMFEYGPVTITKPSPVKQMPSFGTMMKDAGVNVNSEDIKNMMNSIPQTGEQGTAPVEETPAE
jgi:outer membrane lipoprotein-sorting protein